MDVLLWFICLPALLAAVSTAVLDRLCQAPEEKKSERSPKRSAPEDIVDQQLAVKRARERMSERAPAQSALADDLEVAPSPLLLPPDFQLAEFSGRMDDQANSFEQA